MRHWMRSIAACATAGILLTVWINTGNSSGATSSASQTGRAASAATQTGGTLIFGAAQGITNLNPALLATAVEGVYISLLWDGLTTVNREGNLVGDLATKWSSSNNLKTWTFTLRHGVKFSNGTPLTSADVVATFKYYKKPTTITQFAQNVKPITSVTAKGPYTVVFTLSAADSLFPTLISSQYICILDVGALGSIETNPVVTGPFKVKSFVPGTSITLVRNPDYWGPPAKLAGIEIVKAADSSSAVTALEAGNLNALWSVPLSDVKAMTASGNIKIVKSKVLGEYLSWEVDTKSPPFNNVKARQALAYAIDEGAVLRAAYYQQGVVAPTDTPLQANNPDFGGTLINYSYNLAKAKKLFAEAGIKPGATFTWWGVSDDYPEWNISAEILQASLAKIGITLKIQDTSISTWPARFYPAGKSFPGLIIPNFQSFPTDAASEFAFYRGGRCECNWNNAQFDNLYNLVLTKASPAARKVIWQKEQELINQQLPVYVPALFQTETAVRNNVDGIWLTGDGNPHLEDAYLTK